MKKDIFRRGALAALLMSALVFERLPGSVRFFDTVTQTTEAYSFFEINMNLVSTAVTLPLAGLITFLAAALAVVNLFAHKAFLERGILWTSLGAAILSVVPMLIRQEGVLLLPNVVVPVILMVVWLLVLVKTQKTEKREHSVAPDNALRN